MSRRWSCASACWGRSTRTSPAASTTSPCCTTSGGGTPSRQTQGRTTEAAAELNRAVDLLAAQQPRSPELPKLRQQLAALQQKAAVKR